MTSEAYVDEVFGPAGPFAAEFPGYQPRAGQIDFARAVARAIEERKVLLAEAGTGTGKSFGYLVPAIKSVVEHGGKVVVVTANIALQEQVVRKDLPTLRKLLGLPFKFSLAKGFSNYLCREVCDQAQVDADSGESLPVTEEQKLLEKVLAWRADTKTGDLSDFEQELPYNVRRLVVVPSEECSGKKCGYFQNGCFPRAARKSYGTADVIVTNYHLYFLDLEMKRGGARGVLPEHRIVVFDEAHELAEIARSYLGVKVSFFGVRAAAEDLDAAGKRAERFKIPRGIDKELRRDLESEARAFFDDAASLRRSDAYRARLDRSGMIDPARLVARLTKAATVYEAEASKEGLEGVTREWLRHRADLCVKYAGVLVGAAKLEREDDPEDAHIFYIDDDGKKVAVVREPLSPAKLLRASLWESEDPPHALVLASATLTSGSGADRFAYAAREVGVRDRLECVADSPFDFSRCAFVVPRGLPEPNDRSWAGVVGEVLVNTVRAAEGRTLGVFTSRRVLDLAHRRLVEEGLPYTVLKQGDAPRSVLIKRFKEDEQSVLLGTESFRAGVDVPGEALTAVLLDRIPFDHFEDPVLDAVKMRDRDWFRNYYLPKALVAFKQGFGRLVRSLGDRGAVVCCDRRIYSKPYGRAFLRALPDAVRRSERFEDAVAAVSQAVRQGAA